ncbi:MAG TPA: pitrilysin family protein [Fimbriiglobus sp.]
MRLLLAITSIIACIPTLRAADAADDAKLAAKVKTALAGVKHETLPNGLNVYLLPVPSSPVVTTMVAYKVGSGDEDKNQTGLSHYLEHLMFKGTDKLMPGDIDRMTQRNGGANNASTNEDMTVYYFDFASDRWTAALEVEADRMRNLRIDAKHEFQQEKGAVISELKRDEDRPWDLEFKRILPMLFPGDTPYSHPVIGEEADVRNATAAVIVRHYDKWYCPNNASLVIVGGFDPAEAMGKIRSLFGPIPKVELPARKPVPPAPNRTMAVRKEFASKFDSPRLLVGFNTTVVGNPDDDVLDVLSAVLSNGRTSRLYKRLIETDRVASDVSTSNGTGRYPGWFGIQVEAIPGKDRTKVESALQDELAKLVAEPITPTELARVRRGLIATFVYRLEDGHDLCDLIARSVTYTDLTKLQNYLDRVLAVTPADLQRVAKKYFDPHSECIVWSLPAAAGKGEELARSTSGGMIGQKTGKPAGLRSRQAARADAPAAGSAGLDLTRAKKTTLKNGLTLITLENHRLPIVVAQAYVADVRLREPADKAGLAALTGSLLEEGSTKHTGRQIATLTEDAGTRLSFGTSGGSFKALTPDTEMALGLLFECLTEPTVPDEAFARKKEEQLAAIADMETQPVVKASNLFRAMVYGNHPFGRPAEGTKKTVEKLTAADCRAFHKLTFHPNVTTLVVVGDFDVAKLTALVEKATAAWPKGDDIPPKVAAPPKIDKATTAIVTDTAASQTHVFLGHLGITRNDPDYYTLLVMDNVLGTGPGFTDRLSSTLRDRQGLAYTVNAAITGSASEQPGLFQGYIGTFPDKYLTVRDGFLKEFNRIRDEPPSEKEVNDAKRYLLGSLPFRLTSNAAVAAQLLAAQRFGLGFDLLETFKKKVQAVTPEMVQTAAKKHLDPSKLTIVAVGPISSDGRPVKPMK